MDRSVGKTVTYKGSPPLQKLTALETLVPLSLTSATHSVKTFDSFLIEQSIVAIATSAIADRPLAPRPATLKEYHRSLLLLLDEHFFDFLPMDEFTNKKTLLEY
ncbi:hypothetical protein [Prochlorococcus sp. MIT 1307]|uniref:hypothetical protein n=1 Tax=Prochlorococcus sp. MIT 1307 TaxID=3096219 RepID=UPI002A76390F|nr:hypothetical protein [Prochlorococcus sp. MIT 1307]